MNTDKGILADTTVWIEFFGSRSKTGDKLESLLKEERVWLCGMVLFELLQGVKSAEEKSLVLATLDDLPYLEMTRSLWQDASVISASLKRRGLNLPLSDIFIAALAIEHNLLIFTLDNHFNQIPGVRVYKG